MEIYNKLRSVPSEAKKEIQAGRLKGMTDINPMWRIKMLTETFGMCGIGWKYQITNKWLENGCKGQISAFVDVDLFVKINGEWSDAIPGTGGASFITEERNGLYQNDECFKMAFTDALGICCKALGMAADVYFAKDNTKYSAPQPQPIKVETISIEQIESYKLILSKCDTLEDLGKTFKSLPQEVKQNDEIVKYTFELKNLFEAK
jgi:hypothetical protein